MGLVEQLVAIVGREGVLTGTDVTSRPASFWDASPLAADVLVRPKSTEEVSAVLRLCHGLGQAVVTHGGRTGCAMGERTRAGDVVLSMERMNRIEEIDPVERTATVQAGVVLEVLQHEAAKKDLLFPVDLGARGSCTVGGNVATNAGGVNVIRYGMTRESVLGLEAVLADGTVLSSMNRMLKNNAGYDLKQLFIGTEGTLGVVTRVVVRLRERQPETATALVSLPGFEQVAAFLKHMDASLGGALSSYELMYGDYYDASTGPGGHPAPIARGQAFYVIAEAQAADASLAERFETALGAAMEAGLVEDGVIAKSAAEREGVWRVRENFEPIMGYKPQFLFDVSMPIMAMPGYVDTVRAALRDRFPEGKLWVLGHVGDGNLHLFVSPMVGAAPGLHAAVDEIVYAPLAGFGSVSAEHGIGLEKVAYLKYSRSPAEIDVMRLLKRTLDPKGILNPGKVLEAA